MGRDIFILTAFVFLVVLICLMLVLLTVTRWQQVTV